MRLIRMNRRSRYRGMSCLHCHRPVVDDRVAFGSTYYVLRQSNGNHSVATYSRRKHLAKHGIELDEFMVRVVYHRRCIEKILERGPLDREVEQSLYDEYRAKLLERFAEDDADEEALDVVGA